MAIAERCNLKLEKIKNPFPRFDVPEGHTADSYFEQVAREGYARRTEWLRQMQQEGRLRKSFADYEQRLNREIQIIQQMQFSGYFLIVWDFIRYAKEHGIPVGPGRGSAAGSLVGYSMGITDIDPLQNELLFERFLNPERVSLPDIDVDFCMNRRGEVIDYVTRKYGREQVAQIITFGTMAAKAAIKDVGRVLDMPYAEVDRIAKMIPGSPRHDHRQGDGRGVATGRGLYPRAADQRADRHGEKAGGNGAQRRSACRRRGDLSGSAR